MTIVEHIYPGFQWADPWRGKGLSVEQIGSDLQITGLIPRYEAQDSPCDLIRRFEKSPRQVAIGQQRTGTESPDVWFANANSDAELVAFVRRFGPVVAKSVTDSRLIPDKKSGEPLWPGRLIALQDMQELRNEQAIYRATLTLVLQLDRGTHDYVSAQQLMHAIDAKLTERLKQTKLSNALAKLLKEIIWESVQEHLGQPSRGNFSAQQLMDAIAADLRVRLGERNHNYLSPRQLLKAISVGFAEHLDQPIYDYFAAREMIKIIAAKIQGWPGQWEREKSLRSGEPIWKLSPKSLDRIEALGLAPRDPILEDPVSGRIVICELLNSFPSIVFPNPLELHSSIKFGIRPLLYSLLRRQFLYPRGSAICENSECRNFFTVERSGQQYCSHECSLHHRQRVYWQKRGKKLRKKRNAQRKRTK